jgi:hypothetical protein
LRLRMLRHTKAGDIGASSAGQCRFCWHQNVALPSFSLERTPYAGAGSSGGRSSAINRRMSAGFVFHLRDMSEENL